MAAPHPSCARPAAEKQRLPRTTLYAALLLYAVILAFTAQGHSPSRTLQLALLGLPAALLMLWPLESPTLHRLRTVFITLWSAVFIYDGTVRGFLDTAYEAAPDSALIVSAAANTTLREAYEYLHGFGPVAIACLLIATLASVGVGLLARQGVRQSYARPRLLMPVLVVLSLLITLGYALKPWRNLHPALFWTNWAGKVKDTRSAWSHLESVRQDMQAHAESLKPQLDMLGPATVVLVISDSVNRDNLALYGYGRNTTPAMTGLKEAHGDELLVIRNAWSVEASTLPSLNRLFNLKDSSNPAERSAHIIAMAKAAGYRTWWISNHDDIAIEQQHAKLADVVEIVNRIPGRSGSSLDSELLDCVQEAIAEPDARKFIVVHLLGAHPHYRQRYPASQNPFADVRDSVERQLDSQGRSLWIKHQRKQYDAALRFHDHVVAELFAMTRQPSAARPDEYRAWMYLSDHGQEVGHSKDFAGHSPHTAAGYRIPVMIWRNREWPAAPHLAKQAFRADWGGWTVADLLNVHWEGYKPTQNILSSNYEWHSPSLPAPVSSYID